MFVEDNNAFNYLRACMSACGRGKCLSVGVGSLKLSFLKEEGTAVKVSTKDVGLVVDPVLPKGELAS